MKRNISVLLTGIALMLLTQEGAQTNARVVRVVDGDTYIVRKGDTNLDVRLMQIDAPEMKQAFGLEAKQFAKQWIEGKAVWLDSTGLDKYKRVLGSIKIDGKAWDSILVSNGIAWQYVAYSSDTMLGNREQKAIADKIGLWKCGANNVCPPWLFRQYNTRFKKMYCNGCLNH